ncbi:MAG: extracellular solute-binding protein [Tannerella sp.]|nr:extracellular solute-binding protein [Tannerella sp.]
MKRLMIIAVVLVVCTGFAWSGGGQQKNSASADGGEAGAYPDIEVWAVNDGFKQIDIGSPLYKLHKEVLGVGVYMPYVEWNGGVDYLNKLNLQIAAGTMPNMFLPYNGIESELAKNGAIVDLTDLLPKYAPKLWKLIPESAWNVVKANDPTGKGRIYWIPDVMAYELRSGMIRQDWLDKLGLAMPKTQKEYVEVLKAFRDRDPNGNGQKDELPTGGRQGARWMDHLFNMYGVASFEGYPRFDIYNGQLTYSAVTQNAKDALVFIRDLYQQKLLDPETFLNDKATWDGKINTDRVGNYTHITQETDRYLNAIYQNTGTKANITVLPVIQVPGYEGKGFVTHANITNIQWVISAQQDEAHLMSCLRALDEMADQKNWDALYFGVEGMHYELVNGKKVLLPIDKSKQQARILEPYNFWGSVDFMSGLLLDAQSADNKWMIDQDIRNLNDMQQYVRNIASDGMPESVYTDYPDIKNCTLWQEYATKIIIGTFDISKFDEFVQKWNTSGGAEVTKRARDWYAKVAK